MYSLKNPLNAIKNASKSHNEGTELLHRSSFPDHEWDSSSLKRTMLDGDRGITSKTLAETFTGGCRAPIIPSPEQHLRVNYPSGLARSSVLGGRQWPRQQATRHIISKEANKEVRAHAVKVYGSFLTRPDKPGRTTRHKFAGSHRCSETPAS